MISTTGDPPRHSAISQRIGCPAHSEDTICRGAALGGGDGGCSVRTGFDEEDGIAVYIGDGGITVGVGYLVADADRVDAGHTGVAGVANRPNRDPSSIGRHTHTNSALFICGLSADIDEFVP